MSEAHRKLLADAARLYERHEAGRPDSFNVFSVLRSESDEVNLHTRFLAALLDHRKPGEAQRKNLHEFLQSVVNVQTFDQNRVAVERERHNIDILITNAMNQAVVIENKIWAGDQPEQLQRYHGELTGRGYRDEDIHLRYLTPFGHDPSEDSRGELRYEKVAYKDDGFQGWLRTCQQRAYDEPALRESIEQYLRVVQKLTGTDFSEVYMSALKDLCLEKDNLVLVHDLKAAMDEAWTQLILQLFSEIDYALSTELPEKHEMSNISQERVRRLVTGHRGIWCGLYYEIGDGARLGIQFDVWKSGVFFGVHCDKQTNGDTYDKFKRELTGSDGSDDWWPCYFYPKTEVNPNFRNPTQEHLRFLASDDERHAFAASLASELKALWKQIKQKGLDRRLGA